MNEEKINLLCSAMGVSKEELMENLLNNFLNKVEEIFSPNIPNDKKVEEFCTKGRGKCRILSNGLSIPQSMCNDYAGVEYIGNGTFKVGYHTSKITVPMILKIEKNWDKLPSLDLKKLKKYFEDMFGVTISGRALYHIDKGTFDGVKEAYLREINAPKQESEIIKDIKMKW